MTKLSKIVAVVCLLAMALFIYEGNKASKKLNETVQLTLGTN